MGYGGKYDQYEKPALVGTYEKEESPPQKEKDGMFDNPPKSGSTTSLKDWMEQAINDNYNLFTESEGEKQRQIENAVKNMRQRQRDFDEAIGKKRYKGMVENEAIVKHAADWFGDKVDKMLSELGRGRWSIGDTARVVSFILEGKQYDGKRMTIKEFGKAAGIKRRYSQVKNKVYRERKRLERQKLVRKTRRWKKWKGG